MRTLDIVITMAGLGSRFRKIGYKVPKYMIEVNGKSLFEWSLLSLKGYSDIVDKYIFIVMKDDRVDVGEFIKQQCESLFIQKYIIIEIDYLTDGQATTAMLASQHWTCDNKLLIYNIDTYVAENQMNSGELKGDGFIPCFKGEGDHWSFVKLNSEGYAVEVTEKRRISENCTIGAYYFKSCKLFSDLYNNFYLSDENLVKGEKYVAPLYNYLISRGGKVFISQIDNEDVHVLGTPDELEAFKNVL